MTIEKEFKRLPIDDVMEHPGNVRVHGKRNLSVIKNSLQQWGQYKPILVQKSTMCILAGNGTHQAAVSLGWKEIDCNIIDVDDEQAKAILIMDNRSSELSENDEKNLLDMLQGLESDMLDLTGYDNEELDKMLQFHEGSLFGDDKNDKKEKKPKKDKNDAPVSADDQISFILMGYPFTLADIDQIREIKNLMDKFTSQNIEVRCETTFEIWNVIRDVLKAAVSQSEEPPSHDENSVENDRG